MQKLINRRKRGFTLIELLVVVLILAILMAVALPLYLSAVADSERRTCRSNMQTIANAVQAYRVRTRLSTAIPTLSDLTPDLQNNPVCPNQGTYTVSTGTVTGGFKVACSVSAHGSYEPGVDAT